MHLSDLLLPPGHRHDPIARRQGLLLAGILWLGIFTMPIGMIRQIQESAWPQFAVSVITWSTFSFMFALFRWRGVYRPVATGLLLVCCVAIELTCLSGLLIHDDAARLFATLPLLALCLGDRKRSVLWTLLALLGLSSLLFAEQWWGFSPHRATPAPPVTEWINLLILTIYVSGIGLFLESVNQHHRNELEAAKLAAEAANRSKSTFLANMSHELRTPMNAVLGLTEVLLRDPEIRPYQRQYLLSVQSSGRGLVDLLNDLLDLSKVEAGQLEFQSAAWSPSAVVQEIQRTFQGTANLKGLRWQVELSPDVPPYVLGDFRRVRQVLLNLVGNGLKFTVEGSVHLKVSVPSAGKLQFEVRDTGPGISKEDSERLFQPFVQGDAGLSTTQPGTGLGLAICRRMVEGMHGNIIFESELQRGSTFGFCIPAEACAAPALPANTPIAVERTVQPHRQVLMVEDNPINQEVAAAMLKMGGYST